MIDGPVKHLAILASLYIGLVASVPLRSGTADDWAPNPLLLAGLVASRHGVGWAAFAGLLCDGLAGRPLGVTMLIATLVVTIGRTLGPSRSSPNGWRPVAGMFASLLMIEAGARLLAGTIDTTPDRATDLISSLTIAFGTTGVYAVARLCRSAVRPAAGDALRDVGTGGSVISRTNRF